MIKAHTLIVTSLLAIGIGAISHAENYLSGYSTSGQSRANYLSGYSNSHNGDYNIALGSQAHYVRNFGSYFIDKPHEAEYRKRAQLRQQQAEAAANAPLPCGNYMRAPKRQTGCNN